MERAPVVNWAVARRAAALTAGSLPAVRRPEAVQLVADLRVTARRAGELAARYLGLEGRGAEVIKVVDWAGWGEAVRRMADGAVTELGLIARAPHRLNAVRGLSNGALAGLALGFVSRRMLGQYDAFTGTRTLYLVAPTVVAHERSHSFVPHDFRLWIALHEQTHALQFQAAPWLRDHLRTLMTRLAGDDANVLDALAGWRETGEATALLTSSEGRANLAALTSTMTFLEGHADHVADKAGRGHVKTVSQLRRAFHRPASTSALSRFAGSLSKNAQYRDGLAFCTAVQLSGGKRTLATAFESAEALPTQAEIANPASWVARVRG